jgi:23S rRNA pseudouridine2605 synthase
MRAGEKVLPGDVVTVDGNKVVPAKNKIYIAVHKPREFLVSNSDPEGRPLLQDLFRSAIKERLFHVGRLDFLSTGLILFTNDGEFSKLVSHPRAQIEKEYLVETGRAMEDEFLRMYSRGIRVGEIIYRCRSYVLRGPHSAIITLTEGKNREIRNVFASRNIRLKRVHRLRIGPLTLRGIPPGHFRRLTEREVQWFFDHSTPHEEREPLRSQNPVAAPPEGERPVSREPPHGARRPYRSEKPGAPRPDNRPGSRKRSRPAPGHGPDQQAIHGARRPPTGPSHDKKRPGTKRRQERQAPERLEERPENKRRPQGRPGKPRQERPGKPRQERPENKRRQERQDW